MKPAASLGFTLLLDVFHLFSDLILKRLVGLCKLPRLFKMEISILHVADPFKISPEIIVCKAEVCFAFPGIGQGYKRHHPLPGP